LQTRTGKPLTFEPIWLEREWAYYTRRGFVWSNARRGKHSEKGDFYVFTKDEANAMLRLLVTNSYVQFAGKVYRQAKGIPMGINPAVFLANYYLFYYEYRFWSGLGWSSGNPHQMRSKCLLHNSGSQPPT
jgi:hypothetical protein